MKRTILVLLTFLAIFSVFGQDISGEWNGVLKFQGMQLRLVFAIVKTDSGYISTMDSPDQGAKGIPVTTTHFEDSKLKIEITNLRVEYAGELTGDSITGVFKQIGMEFPMNLSKKHIEKQIIKRPQEPTQPYPYFSEEVTFENTQANLKLAGTLTLPAKEGAFPVVVLITGSGPQNRDEELLGHKPFLIIADYLTRNGIAVLRYDDRGIGKSTGDFTTATSLDFATDVESAIAYLKTRTEINSKKIGLIGHSEGGMIAPMVASNVKDVNFIVLLAGTGIRGDKLLLLQQELIARASGATETEIEQSKKNYSKIFEMVINSENTDTLKINLTSVLTEARKNDTSNNDIPGGMSEDEFIAYQVNQITSPWMQYFIKYDPAIILEKVKCSVLAVNGEKDLQVTPKENLSALSNALKKGGNKKVTLMEFPNLNHLFQECTTGSPIEYATIEQTFSPLVLEEITKWILSKTK